MSGVDEEHCDLLEMNRCDQNEEYRCMNGMCIPDQFFLDGEFDCLDWSDELQFKDDEGCPNEIVSSECDDRACPPNQWSCGDGQCIDDPLPFQKQVALPTCGSGRDQYFMCETRDVFQSWTLPNGRCHRYRSYDASAVMHGHKENPCEYLLKCALSFRGEINCPYSWDWGYADRLAKDCPQPLVQYPRGAIIAPYMFFFYNRTRSPNSFLPDLIVINGTVRCRGLLVSVTRNLSFQANLNVRRIAEDLFCVPARNNSSSDIAENRGQCHRANESTDRCNEWNPCMSTTRVKDGWNNCLNARDELDQTEIGIQRSCTRVRRHRFRCSIEQVTCLREMALGNDQNDCHNRFDELWIENGRKVSDTRCNDRWKDECSLLRQYISQSWTSRETNEGDAQRRIPFRFYCDTFWNLDSRGNEELDECRQWWSCSDQQWRCQT